MTLSDRVRAVVDLWLIGVLFEAEWSAAARGLIGPRRVGGNPPL